MKTKIVASFLFALMLCAFLAYNSESVKADSNYNAKTPPFGGYLYSKAGCPTNTELLSGISYTAENRTSGVPYTSITHQGQWGVPNVQVGDLVKVTFTQNGKIGCILIQQTSAGFRDLKVCMLNSASCPYEW